MLFLLFAAVVVRFWLTFADRLRVLQPILYMLNATVSPKVKTVVDEENSREGHVEPRVEDDGKLVEAPSD